MSDTPEPPAGPQGTETADLGKLSTALSGLSIVTGENTENGEQVDANATNTAEAPNPPPNTGQSEADTKGQDECILFVGDLARNLTESELEHAFSRCGKVVSVDIKRDKQTGRNLGYGFVQMSSHAEATEAKMALHDTDLQGRKVRVGWAQRNTALFVGDLDDSITTESLRELFSRFGPILEEHSFVRNGKFGRFGFVKFKHRKHAETARKEMNGSQLGKTQIRVVWNHSHGPAFSHEPVGLKECSIHAQFEADQGVKVTELLIHQIFAPYGEVTGVTLNRPGSGLPEMETTTVNGKKRGYCFVHYSPTPSGKRCAMDAIRALQNQTVYGVRLQCTLSNTTTILPKRRPIPGPYGSLAPALPMKGRGLGQRFPDEGSAYAPYRATSTAPAIGYSPRNLQGGGGRGAPRGWHQPQHQVQYDVMHQQGMMQQQYGQGVDPNYQMYPYYQGGGYYPGSYGGYGPQGYDYYGGGMVASPVDTGAPMDQSQMYHHNTRAGGGSPHVAHGQNFPRGPPPPQHEGT